MMWRLEIFIDISRFIDMTGFVVVTDFSMKLISYLLLENYIGKLA